MIIVAPIVTDDLMNIETLVERESWMTAVSPLSLDTIFKKGLTVFLKLTDVTSPIFFEELNVLIEHAGEEVASKLTGDTLRHTVEIVGSQTNENTGNLKAKILFVEGGHLQ